MTFFSRERGVSHQWLIVLLCLFSVALCINGQTPTALTRFYSHFAAPSYIHVNLDAGVNTPDTSIYIVDSSNTAEGIYRLTDAQSALSTGPSVDIPLHWSTHTSNIKGQNIKSVVYAGGGKYYVAQNNGLWRWTINPGTKLFENPTQLVDWSLRYAEGKVPVGMAISEDYMNIYVIFHNSATTGDDQLFNFDIATITGTPISALAWSDANTLVLPALKDVTAIGVVSAGPRVGDIWLASYSDIANAYTISRSGSPSSGNLGIITSDILTFSPTEKPKAIVNRPNGDMWVLTDANKVTRVPSAMFGDEPIDLSGTPSAVATCTNCKALAFTNSGNLLMIVGSTSTLTGSNYRIMTATSANAANVNLDSVMTLLTPAYTGAVVGAAQNPSTKDIYFAYSSGVVSKLPANQRLNRGMVNYPVLSVSMTGLTGTVGGLHFVPAGNYLLGISNGRIFKVPVASLSSILNNPASTLGWFTSASATTVTSDQNGNVYVGAGSALIRIPVSELSSATVSTSVTLYSGFSTIKSVAFNPATNDCFVSDANGIYRISSAAIAGNSFTVSDRLTFAANGATVKFTKAGGLVFGIDGSLYATNDLLTEAGRIHYFTPAQTSVAAASLPITTITSVDQTNAAREPTSANGHSVILIDSDCSSGITGGLYLGGKTLGSIGVSDAINVPYCSAPTLTSVTASGGCTTSGSGVSGCPLSGVVTLTMTGTAFGKMNFNVPNNNVCTAAPTAITSTTATCTLKTQASQNAQSYSFAVRDDIGSSGTVTVAFISQPTFSSITLGSGSACTSDGSGNLVACTYNPATAIPLVFNGALLSFASMTVNPVAAVICAVGSTGGTASALTCNLNNPIALAGQTITIQFGASATHTLSVQAGPTLTNIANAQCTTASALSLTACPVSPTATPRLTLTGTGFVAGMILSPNPCADALVIATATSANCQLAANPTGTTLSNIGLSVPNNAGGAALAFAATASVTWTAAQVNNAAHPISIHYCPLYLRISTKDCTEITNLNNLKCYNHSERFCRCCPS